MKKSSLSSELLDLSLSRCFLVFLDGFLEWEPEFVLDLSLCFLLLDRFVEVFDLFDFLDLVEFLDLKGKTSIKRYTPFVLFIPGGFLTSTWRTRSQILFAQFMHASSHTVSKLVKKIFQWNVQNAYFIVPI